MQKPNNIFSDKFDCNLESISYKRKADDLNNISIKVKDNIDYIKAVDKQVVFLFERRVSFDPVFDLSVKFIFSRFLKNKNTIIDEGFLLDADDEFLNNLAGPITNRASLLISQITSSSGNVPLITAPVFYGEKQE